MDPTDHSASREPSCQPWRRDDDQVFPGPGSTNVEQRTYPPVIRIQLGEDDDLAVQALEAADRVAQDRAARLRWDRVKR